MSRLLPPHLFLLILTAMIIVRVLWPHAQIIPAPWIYLGLIPVLTGIILLFSGSRLFSKLQTNIKTFNDPQKLVTSGPFHFSRNPMYLGFVLVLFGVSILTGSAISFIFVAIFWFITDSWYIPFEEKRMVSIFGDDYNLYRSRVRRWI